MRKAVWDVWHEFNLELEGRTDYMYCDDRGFVTCGLGNLIDPVEAALPLHWLRHSDNGLATDAEKRAEWARVRAFPRNPRLGGGQYAKSAQLYLQPVDIDAMVRRRLMGNSSILQRRYRYEAWPAPAQLALHSFCWAMGAAFEDTREWPRMAQACKDGDFAECAEQCHIRGAGTIIERNRRNILLFEDAARVVRDGCDPEALPEWRPRVA